MPQQRMDIRMIKDILRLKQQGNLSHERIARSLSISKGVVAKYLGLAGAAGLTWAVVAELDEAALERRLLGREAADHRLVEPDFAHVHVELRRKGVTLMLLWAEYRAAHEGCRTWAYTQFCEHYKRYAKSLKRSMRQHRRAGEKLFIDYAGPTLARLRHAVLADVHAADSAIAALLPSLNERSFQKIDGSRASLFAALDAPALSALAPQRWQWVGFKTVKAHIDYHVEVDLHRYSVPHSLVGLELEARITDALVEVLHRGQRVACHARNSRRGGLRDAGRAHAGGASRA